MPALVPPASQPASTALPANAVSARGANVDGAPRRVSEAGTLKGMCRNIRTLYNFEPPASPDEIEAAALQYVRKISGFTKPSRANEEAFAQAVADVAAISARLLAELETAAPPKDREIEAARARARAAKRYAA